MKWTTLILLTLIICSCGQNSQHIENQKEKTVIKVAVIDSSRTTSAFKNKDSNSTILKWEGKQDSLRNVLLQKLEHTSLKNSFLQEMYLRNVIQVSKDQLFVSIPFNLHGPDCGAPDCYSTIVSFGIKSKGPLVFPEKLNVEEQETGCIEKETKLTGIFQLIDQSDQFVMYHASKLKRTLVLFRTRNETGTLAYYFTEVNKNSINRKNVFNIMNDFNEEDPQAIYPFTSWILTTNE